ncbi:hypothetical protein FO488_17500 [Geobacter sp. FeAm09]|uniref:cytochrome c3 family protein n=1 Tax=Geobacter sp. FeAm09 TaxID=2597769 RepID=UPI0011ED2D99|nr:cytochrome c3 family protein [Geobacter sp. FeAm09]QEM69775.1 hypothetical protein FO488_17500 [Geobacter sp. FeAm09]
MHNRICSIPRMAALVPLFALVVFSLTAHAAPKRLASAKPANCASCHGKEAVLPAGHPSTAGMTLASCRECHAKGGASSLAGKLPLGHIHQLSGVTCVKCHGKTKKPQPVDMAQCVACHGDTDKLAEKTAGVKPQNPHKSPHYGTTLDCNNCHHQHEKAENFCLQCHKFDFVVP